MLKMTIFILRKSSKLIYTSAHMTYAQYVILNPGWPLPQTYLMCSVSEVAPFYE